MPALTTITGSLYDTAGQKRTSGVLRIRPKTFVRNGSDLVSANPVQVVIPPSGNLSFGLVPSGGVPYIVEFDPAPNDTLTPLALKPGYFKNEWLVPSSGPVGIETL